MTSDRTRKTAQRQRVYARRKEIMDLVHAGWSGRGIRTELGLEDIPESSFYYNLKALKREAMTASAILAAELERLTKAQTEGVGEPTPATKKDQASAPSGTGSERPFPAKEKRNRRPFKVTVLGKGINDAPSLDPQKWK